MVDTGSAGRIKVSPPVTIYTVLLIIATLFMIAGTVFLAWKSNILFGDWMPIGPS